jgi:hypothetical protein
MKLCNNVQELQQKLDHTFKKTVFQTNFSEIREAHR